RPPLCPTPLPYTTLFRSHPARSLGVLGDRLGAAGLAHAADLDDGPRRLEPVHLHPGSEPLLHFGVRELGHLSALLADREGDRGMRVTFRMRAHDESIHALQAVHETKRLQLVERTMHLQRRARTLVTKPI